MFAFLCCAVGGYGAGHYYVRRDWFMFSMCALLAIVGLVMPV